MGAYAWGVVHQKRVLVWGGRKKGYKHTMYEVAIHSQKACNAISLQLSDANVMFLCSISRDGILWTVKMAMWEYKVWPRKFWQESRKEWTPVKWQLPLYWSLGGGGSRTDCARLSSGGVTDPGIYNSSTVSEKLVPRSACMCLEIEPVFCFLFSMLFVRLPSENE